MPYSSKVSRDNATFHGPASLLPVEHRWLDFDGARIHYVDEGTGDTLLLLHGNPSWSFLYRKIITRLKDDYRCVAPDYPGYGMSEAPADYRYTPQEHSRFVEQFADTLGLTRLTVMVQDWGGPIGFALAGRRPDLIRAFVVGNTFAWPLGGDPRVALFSRLMGGFIGRSLTWAFNFVPRFFFWRGLALPVAPEVLRLYLASWRPRSRRRAAVIAPGQLTAASEFARSRAPGNHQTRHKASTHRVGDQRLCLRRPGTALRADLLNTSNHPVRRRLALSPRGRRRTHRRTNGTVRHGTPMTRAAGSRSSLDAKPFKVPRNLPS